MWSTDVYAAVRKLFGSGKSDYEIARAVGVPRSTVQKWRHMPPSYTRNKRAETDWQAGDAPSEYCYFTTTLPSGRVKEYAYPRYFFSNLSGDIIAIFREHCALLGVRTSMSNAHNVSISDKESVAILDEVVGPKR